MLSEQVMVVQVLLMRTHIQDFTDGTDVIGLDRLNFGDLTIEQGTGDYANHVVVKKTDTGENYSKYISK